MLEETRSLEAATAHELARGEFRTAELRAPFGRGINLELRVPDVAAVSRRLSAAALPCPARHVREVLPRRQPDARGAPAARGRPRRISDSPVTSARTTGVKSTSALLERVGRDAAPLLENLLELYIHDLSEIVPVEPGPDGRFGYNRLPLYWSEPERRWAFLIRSSVGVAGFALVTRGSPASDDPDALDVAEFFVLRRHRRSGIGREAAFALWDAIPGLWTVRVSEGNRAGIPFWSEVIRAYTGGDFVQSTRPEKPHDRRVFEFRTRASAQHGAR